VREFVLAAMLQAGKPFSLYLAKLLLLLLAGCNSVVNTAMIGAVILAAVALKLTFRGKH